MARATETHRDRRLTAFICSPNSLLSGFRALAFGLPESDPFTHGDRKPTLNAGIVFSRVDIRIRLLLRVVLLAHILDDPLWRT